MVQWNCLGLAYDNSAFGNTCVHDFPNRGYSEIYF